MRKECRDFFFLLSACYFHPERKYSSEEVKELAKQAMISLWLRKRITVWSITFEREFIRDLIINKMMPEDLDRAIAEAERKRWRISFDHFVEMMFVSVLFGDAIVDSSWLILFSPSLLPCFSLPSPCPFLRQFGFLCSSVSTVKYDCHTHFHFSYN